MTSVARNLRSGWCAPRGHRLAVTRRGRVRHRAFPRPGGRLTTAGFTLVEALVALSVLLTFLLGACFGLLGFNRYAATNRNTESARIIVEDYTGQILSGNYSSTGGFPSLLVAKGAGTPTGQVTHAPQQVSVIDPASQNLTQIVYVTVPTVDNGEADDAGNPLGQPVVTGIPIVGTRQVDRATGVSVNPIVKGDLYERCLQKGTSYGLGTNQELCEVTLQLRYTYRGKTYYQKAFLLKAQLN